MNALPSSSRSLRILAPSNRLAVALIVLLTVCVNLRLLSNYNVLTPDADFWLSGAYPLTHNLLETPRHVLLSHAFPSLAVISQHPPLYFMLSAAAFKIAGFSVLTVGLLHLICRVASTLLMYFLCRKWTLSVVASVALAALWCLFVAVPFQRPEDVGLAFVLAAVHCFVPGDNPTIQPKRMVWAGAFSGLAFLCHPSFLYLVAPVFAFLFFNYRHVLKPSHYLLFGGAAGLVGSYWLFVYVLPHWEAFRETFFDFAVNHSRGRGGDYTLQYLREITTGGYQNFGLPAFTYSSLGVIAVFLLVYGMFVRGETSVSSRAVPIAVIGLLAFLLHGHRPHSQLVILLPALLLILSGYLLSRSSVESRLFRRASSIVAVGVVYQAGIIMAFSALRFAANTLAGSRCYRTLDSEIRGLTLLIPHGDKIVVSLYTPPEVWLDLLPTNTLYRYTAVKGETAGGVEVRSRYDSTFKWLILPGSTAESRPDWAKPKDSGAMAYFTSRYRLVKVLNIHQACDFTKGLVRFADSRADVYTYTYSGAVAPADSAGQGPVHR
jgi:hypothetical protein